MKKIIIFLLHILCYRFRNGPFIPLWNQAKIKSHCICRLAAKCFVFHIIKFSDKSSIYTFL